MHLVYCYIFVMAFQEPNPHKTARTRTPNASKNVTKMTKVQILLAFYYIWASHLWMQDY